MLRIEGLLEIIAKEAINAGNKLDDTGKAAEQVAKPETLSKLNNLFDVLQKYGTLGMQVAHGFTEAAVAGDRQATAIQRLGPAWNEVRDATRGTVTAQEAFQLQQQLLQSGLPTTGRELATITRAARDYAHATGVDTTQALQQMGEALRNGEAGGLRRFGIAVQTGSTRTATFESAIRQLAAAQNGSAPAAHTAAEAQEALSNSVTTLTQSFALLIAQKTELFSFFTELSGYFTDLSDGSRTWGNEVTNIARNLRGEAMQQADDGGVRRRSEFLQQFTEQLRTIREAGGDTTAYSRFNVGLLAQRGTEQQQQRLIAQMQVEAREVRTNGGLGAAQVLRLAGAGDALSEIDRTQRERDAAAQAERDRVEAERRRQSARERQAMTPGASASQTAAARLAMYQARLAAQAAGLGDQLGVRTTGPVDTAASTVDDRQLEALRRAATDITPNRNENAASVMTRQAAAMQTYIAAVVERSTRERELSEQLTEANRAEKNLAVERATAADALIDSSRRERTSIVEIAADRQRAENELATSEGRVSEVNRQRITQLADVRTALQALLAETNARIAQAEAEHRSQSEINDLIRERVGLTRSLAQTTGELATIQRENSQATRDFAGAMGGAGLSAASAFTDAIWTAAEANQSFEASLQNALREQLKALSKEAVPNVLKNLALGTAAAFTNPPAAAGFFAAAGLWGAVGIAAGAGAAAIPSATPKPTASPSAERGAANARPATLPPGESGPLTLQISVSGAMFNEGVQESIVRGLDAAHSRGLVPRFARELNG